VTIQGNGRPQPANVLHHVSDNGIIRISIPADRVNYHNLSRDPWAALHITTPDFFSYAVLNGDALPSPIAAKPDDAAVDEMVEHYKAVVGVPEDSHEFRKQQVAERRVMVRFTPTRAYGMLNLPASPALDQVGLVTPAGQHVRDRFGRSRTARRA
jgi:PPOX class probable F420-dependent enzyme